MKRVLHCLILIPFLGCADPAVQNVQVNIHNDSKHKIELLNFTASRIFASTRIKEKIIPAGVTESNAIFFTSFDKQSMTASVDILHNGKPMKMMWDINLGFGGPADEKSHLCGVIKDGSGHANSDYCDIPYVDNGILYIDFIFD